MIEIVSLDKSRDLDGLKVDWSRLCEHEPQYVPSFSQLRDQLRNDDAKYRLLVAVEGSQVMAIACFIYNDTIKRFEVATKRLFDLPVREVSLFGSCMPGQPSEEIIRKVFQIIIDDGGFDLISLGEIFIDAPLYRVATNLCGIVAWRVMRQNQLRWITPLPGSFNEYVTSLGPKTRRNATRYRHKVESRDHEYRLITSAADVLSFLRDAEMVSRSTYQWNLGYRLDNNDGTRERFVRLAKEGALRAYLLYIQGKPSAFAWGEVAHRKFLYQAIGYTPEHGKLSPGMVLYMWLVQDLIENTDCEVFDFGAGGRDGYKSRLATLSLSCARMQMAQIRQPYSLMIFIADQTLNFIKNTILKSIDAIFAHGMLKQRLKSALRPFGVGSY